MIASTPVRIQSSKHQSKYPIGEIKIKPGEQPHLSLGRFSEAHPPRGFSVHLSPNPQDDAIVTQVTSIGANDKEYTLTLHIANYGTKTVSAEVWEM